MINPTARFAQHQQQRDQLQGLFTSALEVFERLELPSDRSTLEIGQAKLAADTFKVLILGEFKRGKSTFINAMLGQEVLPAFSIPCTAVINEIKWGDDKSAVLHFVNPAPDSYTASVPTEVHEHRTKHQGYDLPPMPVPVQEIERYVVIPDPGKDQGESVAESPYSLVEIFWPLDICRNSVEIIDSPGLNEHGTRTRITTDYLAKVDAVIFVLSCQALASQSEMQFIETNVRAGGHEDIFFVCNRFDEVRPNERDLIVSYGQKKLKDKTSFGTNGIYFISALSALDGRLQKDSGRLESSGILPLEDHLSSFLVNDRGRVKLLQPARDLRRLLNKIVFEYIPTQKKMLEGNLAELEKRYAEVQPRLKEAEHKRLQIRQKIETGRQRLRDGVRREVSSFVKDLAVAIPAWLENYELQSQFKFISLEGSKKQAEAIIKELTNFVSNRVEQEQGKWQKDILQPFMRERMEELGDAVRGDIEVLLQAVDSMKTHVGGAENISQRNVDPFERVLAAATGWFIGGAGSSLVGGMLGFKEMLKSLIPNIAIVVAMVLLGVANPFVLIAALLAAGSIQGLISTKSLTKDFRAKIGQELAARLRDTAEDAAEKAGAEVYLRSEGLMRQLDAGLEKEINGVKETVDTALAAKRKGEAQARSRSAMLDEVLMSVKTMQADLDDMLFTIQTKA